MHGRGDEWQVIHEDRMSVPFKDIVWYQDRLWCTSEYGLWTLGKDGTLGNADIPALATACGGNLSTADGILMVGGLHGAAIHDGSQWHGRFDAADAAPSFCSSTKRPSHCVERLRMMGARLPPPPPCP